MFNEIDQSPYAIIVVNTELVSAKDQRCNYPCQNGKVKAWNGSVYFDMICIEPASGLAYSKLLQLCDNGSE